MTLALQATLLQLDPAPVDPLAAGYSDLELAELLLEFAPISSPPYGLAVAGLVIGVLCGLTFSRLVSQRLDAWKQDRLALLPLARIETVLPCSRWLLRTAC